MRFLSTRGGIPVVVVRQLASMKFSFGSAMAIFSAVCYGVAMPLSRLSYDHGANALTIMTLRYLVLALALGIWLLASGRTLGLPWRPAAACAIIGLTFVGSAGGTLGAILYMPVSLAVLVFYTYPILTVVTECILEARWPHALEILALLLVVIGLSLTLQVDIANLHIKGIALALIASFSAAAAMILSSRTLRFAGTRLVGFYSATVAFVISAFVMVRFDALSLPDSRFGLSLLGVIIATFSLAILAMFASLKSIGASRSATLFCFEPVVGILFAILLLGERLLPIQWVGAALVGVAILTATKIQSHTKEL